MSGLPFTLVSWHQNFLPALLHLACQPGERPLAETVFVFPHRRAAQYMTRLLATAPYVTRPLVMPTMLTVSEVVGQVCRMAVATPLWQAGLLDRVGLLLASAREEAANAGDDAPPLLAGMDADRFFPWGVRLANLFEECFTHLRRPENFRNMEGQTTPFAAALLARLAHLFTRYEQALAQRGWTTPGHSAFLAARHAAGGGALPDALCGERSVFFAGFHTLTGAEDLLLRRLWEDHGARVVLHADPALTAPHTPQARQTNAHGTPHNGHWSCRTFSAWASSWRTHITPVEEETPHTPPRMTFYEGFDLHSQLNALTEHLTQQRNEERAERGPSIPESKPENDAQPTETAYEERWSAPLAVVLPESGLLLPALHHLPKEDCNISMGYPLGRSPLAQLLHTLLSLQEKRRGNTYYWRDLVDLARHPYLKMLSPSVQAQENSQTLTNNTTTGQAAQNTAGTADATLSLRGELHRLEKSIRESGALFVAPFTLLREEYASMAPGQVPPLTLLHLLDTTLNTSLTAFESPNTPAALGAALEQFCALLLEHGAALWERFPIDGECLHRLLQSVIPELLHSSLAGEELPRQTLFNLVRQLLDAERVPFTASPLVGTQVLGMLETRLLSFKRVYVLDATDENLPGIPMGDPLLPDTLRAELGLPSVSGRNETSAYHFFRLLAGAEEVVLLWQQGADAGLEQKQQKSRFVEELVWEQEKRQGCLVHEPGSTAPYVTLATSLAPQASHTRAIAATPDTAALVHATLGRGVSASLLESYLRCPVQFFHERAANLAEPDEAQERDDPLEVGNLLHKTLQEFFTPCLGRPFPPEDASPEALQDLMQETFTACLKASPLPGTLPADAGAMLQSAANIRLHAFLEAQMQLAPMPLAVEHFLEVPFCPVEGIGAERKELGPRLYGGQALRLKGKLDRIDMREKGLVILDYKTGSIPRPDHGVWHNSALWDHMATWQPGTPERDAMALERVAAALPRVQLPFYLHLCSMARQTGQLSFVPEHVPLWDAAFVGLADFGEEHPLFAPYAEPETRLHAIHAQIPLLVSFLIRHMAESSVYFPRQGEHCLWCSCKKTCMISL
ncbi:PD-(D/E)XK nuclease family protein [Desulfovibrio cuneatus]|uniref:PD-(D/E)XK nuclease family protein n=1 Tax=Desulfovibrio cuneatus TaxID=159728 RepID=UPI0004048CA4|nr:PD-(D/E)XK nuclease family protein [Desulfovibrio cuneatus]